MKELTVTDLIESLSDFGGDSTVTLGEAGLYIEGYIISVPEMTN